MSFLPSSFWRLPCFSPCFTDRELKIMEKFENLQSSSSSSVRKEEEEEKGEENKKNNKKRRPALRYAVDFSLMPFESESTHRLCKYFVPSNFDLETQSWLEGEGAPSWVRQGVSDLLTNFFGRTSANGIAFHGKMHVFSPDQLARLFIKATSEKEQQKEEEKGEEGEEKTTIADVVPKDIIFDDVDDIKKSKIGVTFSRYNLVSSSSSFSSSSSSSSSSKVPVPHSMMTEDENSNKEKISQQEEEGEEKEEGKDEKDNANLLLEENKKKKKKKNEPLFEYLKKHATVFDIGAGDGDGPTSILSHFFSSVSVSEDNAVMRLRLMKSYGVSNVYSSEQCTELLQKKKEEKEEEEEEERMFDVISLLNVLDRCDKPLTLLGDIHSYLIRSAKSRSNRKKKKKKNEEDDYSTQQFTPPPPPLLLVATVLPWCPFVEDGTKQLKPTEGFEEMKGAFCGDGATFEKSLERLLRVFERIGFRLKCWTRVPYLSVGDDEIAYFALEDSLMLLEAVEPPSPSTHPSPSVASAS